MAKVISRFANLRVLCCVNKVLSTAEVEELRPNRQNVHLRVARRRPGGIANSCPTPCSQEELARGSQTCVQLPGCNIRCALFLDILHRSRLYGGSRMAARVDDFSQLQHHIPEGHAHISPNRVPLAGAPLDRNRAPATAHHGTSPQSRSCLHASATFDTVPLACCVSKRWKPPSRIRDGPSSCGLDIPRFCGVLVAVLKRI